MLSGGCPCWYCIGNHNTGCRERCRDYKKWKAKEVEKNKKEKLKEEEKNGDS